LNDDGDDDDESAQQFLLNHTLQLVSPRVVVTQLLATLQHRNWRVRQEVILLISQVNVTSHAGCEGVKLMVCRL
jgi:hypothetical protein